MHCNIAGMPQFSFILKMNIHLKLDDLGKHLLNGITGEFANSSSGIIKGNINFLFYY